MQGGHYIDNSYFFPVLSIENLVYHFPLPSLELMEKQDTGDRQMKIKMISTIDTADFASVAKLGLLLEKPSLFLWEE